MTQLPNAIPPGVDPTAYLNYLSQLQVANQRQNQQVYNQQNQLAAQQQLGAQNTGNQQFALLLQLLQNQSGAYQDAKNANAKRQGDIMDRDLATRNRLLDYVSQYGQSTLDDVNRADKALRGRDTANLAAAGFLGASPDMMRGADIVDTRANLENLNRAKDSLLKNAISVDQNSTNRLSDFQERVTDAYPDQSSINSLVSQLGSMLPGTGGIGGGIGGGIPGGQIMPNQAVGGMLMSDRGGAIPVPHLTPHGAPLPPPPTGYDIAKANAAKMQQPQQTPWNYGKYPGANSDSQVRQFTTNGNGGVMPLQQSMPALGIFGAGVQMAYTPPNYPTQGSPYGISPTIPYGGGGYNNHPFRGSNPYYQQRLVDTHAQTMQGAVNSQNNYANLYSPDNPFGPNSPYGNPLAAGAATQANGDWLDDPLFGG